MKREYTIIISNETTAQSLVRDSFTFGCLTFCIWFSQGSKLWTFICACMFLMWLGGKAAYLFKMNVAKFKTKEEAAKFLSAIPE